MDLYFRSWALIVSMSAFVLAGLAAFGTMQMGEVAYWLIFPILIGPLINAGFLTLAFSARALSLTAIMALPGLYWFGSHLVRTYHSYLAVQAIDAAFLAENQNKTLQLDPARDTFVAKKQGVYLQWLINEYDYPIVYERDRQNRLLAISVAKQSSCDKARRNSGMQTLPLYERKRWFERRFSRREKERRRDECIIQRTSKPDRPQILVDVKSENTVMNGVNVEKRTVTLNKNGNSISVAGGSADQMFPIPWLMATFPNGKLQWQASFYSSASVGAKTRTNSRIQIEQALIIDALKLDEVLAATKGRMPSYQVSPGF
jgi:hypothetical protein